MEIAKKKIKKVKFTDVILDKEKKESILEAVSQHKNNVQIFSDWGFEKTIEKGKGITLLFWGKPGTGKTLMAQAIAEELGMQLHVFNNADFESSEMGGTERTIRRVFQEATARNTTEEKVVILLDECDSLLMSRDGNIGMVLSSYVNALLTEIENYEGIVILATNRANQLDKALERRISLKVEFCSPGKAQRKAIWRRLIPAKAPLAKDVDFETLASYKMDGGNIKNAVLNAARTAAFKKEKEITMKHLKTAAERELESLRKMQEESKGSFRKVERKITKDKSNPDEDIQVSLERSL